MTSGVRKVFRSHGEFCSTQPWEVIVATLTFLVCILTVWGRHNTDTSPQLEKLRTDISEDVVNGFKNVINTNLNPNVLNPNATSITEQTLRCW